MSYNMINNSFLAKINHKAREMFMSESTILVRNMHQTSSEERQNSDSYFVTKYTSDTSSKDEIQTPTVVGCQTSFSERTK